MLYADRLVSNWFRNHRRRWANDSGTTSGRAVGRSGSRARVASATEAASPATVGVSKTARIGSSTPSTARMRLISLVASREWPPKKKKLSSMLSQERPSTSPKRAHRSRSRWFLGDRPDTTASSRGAGRARRSSLPLAVNGRAGSSTKAVGTMATGRDSAAWRRSSSGSQVRPGAGTR